MHQVQCETLECRTDKELAQLITEDVEVRAPRNWREWVDAFINLFSPVNRIVLLARTISLLQQGNGEPVDSYGVRVTQEYARLLAEATRTAPANVSPYKHAWQTSLMATFEAGLILNVRPELIREDPSPTYQASRTRAKKHETNASRATPTPAPTTHAMAVTDTSPWPDRQLITSMAKGDRVQNDGGARPGQTRDVRVNLYGPSDKRGRSTSGDAGKTRKPKVTSGKEFDYPMCRHRNSRSRPDCRLDKAHERDGNVVTQKP